MNKFFIIGTMISGLLFASVALAGKEDWTGTINVRDAGVTSPAITHSSTRVSFGFISAGTCVQLGKGTTFNGFKIKNDVNLCVDSNVKTFTDQVNKLGTITKKEVKLGPTYHD